MKRRSFALALALLVTALARSSSAHDPFEITAVARTDARGVVLEMTMARATALRLATGTSAPRATFAPEAFAEYRPKLAALGPSLYDLVCDGRSLSLRVTSVALTDERDVAIALASTAPYGARLRFRARHLAVLPEGYTSALSVSKAGGKPTHFKLLTAADATLDVELERASEPRHSRFLGEYWPILVFAGVLLAGRIVERLTWRRKSSPQP